MIAQAIVESWKEKEEKELSVLDKISKKCCGKKTKEDKGRLENLKNELEIDDHKLTVKELLVKYEVGSLERVSTLHSQYLSLYTTSACFFPCT